jgi:hypothetical protein
LWLKRVGAGGGSGYYVNTVELTEDHVWMILVEGNGFYSIRKRDILSGRVELLDN